MEIMNILIEDFFGVLKNKENWKESEEKMKSFRMSFNKRIEKVNGLRVLSY